MGDSELAAIARQQAYLSAEIRRLEADLADRRARREQLDQEIDRIMSLEEQWAQREQQVEEIMNDHVRNLRVPGFASPAETDHLASSGQVPAWNERGGAYPPVRDGYPDYNAGQEAEKL